MDLGGVALHLHEVGGNRLIEHDGPGERLLNDADHFSGDVLELGGPLLAGGAVREPKDLLHEPRAARRALLERLEDLEVARAGQALAQHRRRKHDRGEHIVQVVGDARGEHADGLEALRVEEFLLEQLLLRYVHEEVQPGAGPPRLVLDLRDSVAHDEAAAVAGFHPKLAVPESVALDGRAQRGNSVGIIDAQQFIGRLAQRLGAGPAEDLLGPAVPKQDLVGEIYDHHAFVRPGQDLVLLAELGVGELA